MENRMSELETARCIGSLRQFQALKVVDLKSSFVAEPVRANPSVRQGTPFLNTNGILVTLIITQISGPSARDITGEVVISKLVDLLPASIEEFYLTVVKAIPHLKPMFERFVEQHTEALPNLRWLCLTRGTHANVNLWEKMDWEAAIEVDIRLAYPYPPGNTEVMKAGMAAFLERRSQSEEWQDGGPWHWDIPASLLFKWTRDWVIQFPPNHGRTPHFSFAKVTRFEPVCNEPEGELMQEPQEVRIVEAYVLAKGAMPS
jgi:hypothetical protein